MRAVLLENLDLAPGKICVEIIQIGFVVQVEGTRIEIRRAYGQPEAVHDHYLTVVQRGLIFVDFDTGLEQISPARAPGASHRLAIGIPADRYDLDVHPALHRIDQRLDRQRVRNEIRAGQMDGLGRRGDREQVHQTHTFDAACRRTAEYLRFS